MAGHTSHSFVALAIRRAVAWRVRVFIPYVSEAYTCPFSWRYVLYSLPVRLPRPSLHMAETSGIFSQGLGVL